ncbi:MAG: hypothetical protein HRT92_05165 [Piscirickettsiaceae bacterium]|nr:hypothetical protein [Piscirickettsiaceae bacterium]
MKTIVIDVTYPNYLKMQVFISSFPWQLESKDREQAHYRWIPVFTGMTGFVKIRYNLNDTDIHCPWIPRIREDEIINFE